MATRRQEKVSKLIRNTVSGVIQSQLHDPRICGLISVTHVDLSPDFRCAHVYLSILGVDVPKQELVLAAIKHAHGFIQTRVAAALTSKNCPSLDFFLDDSLKKGSEVLRLIDQVSDERSDNDENWDETQLGPDPNETDL